MPDILDYFPEKIMTMPNSGCWIWLGTMVTKYGRLCMRDERILAHRLSWEISNGRQVPDGYHVDHLCRVTLCVNPDHLEPVTQRENNFRYLAKHLGVPRPADIDSCINGHSGDFFVHPSGRLRCRVCHVINLRKLRAKRGAIPRYGRRTFVVPQRDWESEHQEEEVQFQAAAE